MTSEALAVERLGPNDVAGGLALSDAAGWNQTVDDWSFFIRNGETFGLRDDDGALIASAAALPYDARTGWISMVLVDAAHRHRGLASRLVDVCVAALRDTGRTPVLDATPAGAAVYAKLGFVGGFTFDRWEGEADAVEVTPSRARTASAADTGTLIDLDRLAGGVDRAALLRAFLVRSGTRAWLTGKSNAFAISRAGRRAVQIGPVVARDEGAAIELVAASLAGFAGPVFVDVPAHCVSLASELARRSFVRQRSFVRMALGDARAAAQRDAVFALAGPEFG